MKSASAYFLKDRIIVHPKSQAKAGYWLADEPYISLNASANEEEVVNAILASLEASKKSVPNPADWGNFQKKQLEGFGLKSWNPISRKDTKHCVIDLKDDVIAFIPTKHDPEKAAGFLHKEDEAVKIARDASRSQIYSSLQEAVNKCE